MKALNIVLYTEMNVSNFLCNDVDRNVALKIKCWGSSDTQFQVEMYGLPVSEMLLFPKFSIPKTTHSL
jgi:hypothetical protein